MKGHENSSWIFGESQHVEGIYEGKIGFVTYDGYGRVFFDLQILQKAMIPFYILSQDKVEEGIKFVILLNESEILNIKILERFFIT